VVAWLYDALVSKLSDRARAALEASSDLKISPMVRLELQYLNEIGRISASPAEILQELRQRIGLMESDPKMATVIESALSIHWTRDTFDWLIVAEAHLAQAQLVSKDQLIRQHYAAAIW
jgi:PIN domain nuclease of toxin-antitoxin system